MKKLLIGLGLLFCVGKVYAATTVDSSSYSASVALTCTGFNSLAGSSTTVSCNAVDNTSNLYLDAYVTITSSTGATAVSTGTLVVYLYASEDGSNYEEEESSSPAGGGAITLNATTNFRQVAFMSLPSAGKLYTKTFNVASAYGGVMPRKWGILIQNFGGNLASANNTATYTGIKFSNQ